MAIKAVSPVTANPKQTFTDSEKKVLLEGLKKKIPNLQISPDGTKGLIYTEALPWKTLEIFKKAGWTDVSDHSDTSGFAAVFLPNGSTPLELTFIGSQGRPRVLVNVGLKQLKRFI